MRRPARVEEVRVAPVGEEATGGSDESGEGEADSPGGDRGAGHVGGQDIH